MTQELYQTAMRFAGEKHREQKVPGTKANYLLHIANVSMEVMMAHSFENSFDLNFAIQAAILHDTIEDTNTDYQEIEELFGTKIANAVQALTKNEFDMTKKESMIDSLTRINQSPKEVGIVKLADRITNLQNPPKYWSKEKIYNYSTEAKLILKSLKGKNRYLENRLEAKILNYDKSL